MSLSDSDRRQLLDLIADVLDGDLDVESREWLNALLKQSAEARRFYRRHLELHSQLHTTLVTDDPMGLDLAETLRIPVRTPPASPSAKLVRFALTLAAAVALVAAAGLFGQLRNSSPASFATLVSAEAAIWGGSKLPTAEGARLGEGTLLLVEGLARLRFDSGAELMLEGPTQLTLVDAMNVLLHQGTVVGDMPESAHGFRVATASAEVIDLGTRFATSYHEATGETYTQVLEGSVKVASTGSDTPVELHTGQRIASGRNTSRDVEATEQAMITQSVEPGEFTSDWMFLETVKDAYTGRVRGHESNNLLYVKRGIQPNSPHRQAYLGFDLSGVDPRTIEEAELILHFTPTGVGLASLVGDCEFEVAGLAAGHASWDQRQLRAKGFPGHATAVSLGSFILPRGVQRGHFGIRTEALRDFLRAHPGDEVTFRVVRLTPENGDGGLVHGFASRRHPLQTAPTLALRITSP